ncbi:hypothetical protein [Variovorax arabinosiphilus]|uniref:hypothetical protein n=1 Tax=Variovorax arabinosiphilus TaxID=3053498 RepID=UPI002579197E|nr:MULTISPECIES: hypothetical protein [unclassified Variovorax]MDM0118687.1 hypothetical protein [Variovorax sp. J2L1-78]MDM0129112.1 hypothetical protein [Variovorax sp. J2L1-63]MDM0233101.1 hypothetical protein [Variovorax sp. J2R1-6]
MTPISKGEEMKKLVAVRGAANHGKSSSIKKFYELLMHQHPAAHAEEIFVGNDITVIVTVDGMKIGIESQGDPNSRLFASLARFVREGCEVIVCATRTRGRTVEAVASLSAKYQVEWLEKEYVPTPELHGAANTMLAKKILCSVQAALDA